MGAESDEEYDGKRCVICGERFASNCDQVTFLPETGERVHRGCWE